MYIEQASKFFIPVLLSALLGSIIHRHHKDRERLIDALCKFKEAFTPALRIIGKKGITYEEVGQFTSFFDSQHDAMITFRDNLEGRRRRIFDEKWSEYKKWQKIYKNYDEGTRMIAISLERGRDFHQIVNDLFSITEMHFVSLYLCPPKKKDEYNKADAPAKDRR